jgi:hypothetical protein
MLCRALEVFQFLHKLWVVPPNIKANTGWSPDFCLPPTILFQALYFVFVFKFAVMWVVFNKFLDFGSY